MNTVRLALLWTICFLLAGGQIAFTAAEDHPPPNFLIIMADDLGYSDLGCYGGEIATPVLDHLAEKGLRYSQFYSTARCWPSRAALLTGYYPQQVRRDKVPGIKSGMEGTRPNWAPLWSSVLKHAGYRCFHSGKWHLDGSPGDNGFDRFYLLNDHDRYFGPRNHSENGKALPTPEPGSYYASSAIADRAIEYLQEHHTRYPNQPFFQFLAFTAPHFPLQAPQSDIDTYRPLYEPGWDALRQGRWNRLQKLGHWPGALSPPEEDLGPPYDFPDDLKQLGQAEINRPIPWKSLTNEQRTWQRDKLAIHAAMVSAMDREIGRVLEQLQRLGSLDDTVIIFCSDNGASAEIMIRGEGHDLQQEPGGPGTFLCLGPGGATLANTPFRKHKTWVHEGGIASPLIIHWPQGIDAPGSWRTTPCHLIDIVPTLRDLAGIWPTVTTVAPQLPGFSLLPTFSSDTSLPREFLWWQHEENRAVRQDDWKLVASGPAANWELYDLRTDRTETRNLANQFPDRVAALEKIWEKQRDQFVADAASPDLTRGQPRLVKVRKIWEGGKHNAFTDLVRFRDQWWCAFREGAGHVSPDGLLRILSSRDGETWESAAEISLRGADLRDAKLCVTPENRLLLSGAAALHDRTQHSHQTLAWLSDDGKSWSDPIPIGDPDFWLWRIQWHQGLAWSLGYACTPEKSVRLYTSRDGQHFETKIPNLGVAGYPNESSFVFSGDRALCLLRRDGNPSSAMLGKSTDTGTTWSWHELNLQIGGPHLITLPDGRLLAAVRLYQPTVRTALVWLDPDQATLTPCLDLPSGGDCSYAGLAYHENRLWVSYYSSHEGKSCIYLAEVALDQ